MQPEADDPAACAQTNASNWADPFGFFPLTQYAFVFNDSELFEQLPPCNATASLPANFSESEQEELEALQLWAFSLLSLPCLTIFGNGVVVVSIIKEKMLRTGINYFMLSLALADIFVGLILMPLAIYVEVNNGRWQLSFLLCDAYVSLDVFFCTASIFNITMICLDRYLAVTHPVSYARKMGKQRVLWMVSVAWLLSVLIASPLASGLNASYEAEVRESCTLNNPTFIIYSSIGSFFVPCFIMIPLYGKVLLVIYQHSRRSPRNNGWVKDNIMVYSRKCQQLASNTAFASSLDALTIANSTAVAHANNGSGPPSPYTGNAEGTPRGRLSTTTNKMTRNRALIRKETKATITLLLVVGVFLCLWLPFFTLNVLTALCLQSSHFNALCTIPSHLITLSVWLGYIQSLLNPIIYALSNYEYRKAFRKLFRCTSDPYRNWHRSRSYINHFNQYETTAQRRETLKLLPT